MSKPKLTKAMRKVLEMMEKCVIFSDESDTFWWGDTGEQLTLNEESIVANLVIKDLMDNPLMLVASKIKPAGRRALKEEK